MCCSMASIVHTDISTVFPLVPMTVGVTELVWSSQTPNIHTHTPSLPLSPSLTITVAFSFVRGKISACQNPRFPSFSDLEASKI
ncbi:hypothetical protein MRB53_024712 [Persea americana]|uniref:Uncharacterized protein n=1 Tax=Persea americana TaxID=3435 RepID=A0ACC2LD43_PERAE|nr:hypothetical protein MRB53_024712 [Persea americana]